ncbi:hypothetical protein [Enterococcus lactis]|uniref:hypothetical protein n=1 Tax=Enterococcus lactis TaxID=357441 RepID=UPI003F744323
MSAYFRRSCFCFRRLYVFRAWDKSVLDFCPTLYFLRNQLADFSLANSVAFSLSSFNNLLS